MGFFSNINNTFSDVAPFAGAGIGAYFGGAPGAALGMLAGSQFQANRANQQNFGLSEKQFSQNLAFQKEQYEYSKNLQQEIFNREDDSIQRRAADLSAAGLSKTLAAGSGAGAGAAVPTAAPQGQAPRREVNQILAQNAIALASLGKDLQLKDANIANLAKQNSNLDAQGDLIKAQSRAANAGAALDIHDLKYMQEKNLWRGSGSSVRNITDVESQIDRARRQVQEAYEAKKEEARRKYNSGQGVHVIDRKTGKRKRLSFDEWWNIVQQQKRR